MFIHSPESTVPPPLEIPCKTRKVFRHNTWFKRKKNHRQNVVMQTKPLSYYLDGPFRKLGSMVRKWAISTTYKWGNNMVIIGVKSPTDPMTLDPSTSIPGLSSRNSSGGYSNDGSTAHPGCHSHHQDFFQNFHCSWWYMGVSKNSGTPKWMIYNGKPH